MRTRAAGRSITIRFMNGLFACQYWCQSWSVELLTVLPFTDSPSEQLYHLCSSGLCHHLQVARWSDPLSTILPLAIGPQHANLDTVNGYGVHTVCIHNWRELNAEAYTLQVRPVLYFFPRTLCLSSVLFHEPRSQTRNSKAVQSKTGTITTLATWLITLIYQAWSVESTTRVNVGLNNECHIQLVHAWFNNSRGRNIAIQLWPKSLGVSDQFNCVRQLPHVQAKW